MCTKAALVCKIIWGFLLKISLTWYQIASYVSLFYVYIYVGLTFTDETDPKEKLILNKIAIYLNTGIEKMKKGHTNRR